VIEIHVCEYIIRTVRCFFASTHLNRFFNLESLDAIFYNVRMIAQEKNYFYIEMKFLR